MNIIKSAEKYALAYTKLEPLLLRNLIDDTLEKVHGSQMLSGRIVGRLLKFLVQISNAKLVIDLGTFTGYSALSLAEGLPVHGRLITIDKNMPCLELARKYFAKSPHGHKIELKFGLVADILPNLPDDIDLIFMDADKQMLLEYYEILLPKLKKGGIIIIDNALWDGRVLTDDRRSRNLHNFNTSIAADNRVENVILPFLDGVNLVRKK
jgi:caffeoyl-CoA O-methyltransferase